MDFGLTVLGVWWVYIWMNDVLVSGPLVSYYTTLRNVSLASVDESTMFSDLCARASVTHFAETETEPGPRLSLRLRLIRLHATCHFHMQQHATAESHQDSEWVSEM
jgi:hypothetical protein